MLVTGRENDQMKEIIAPVFFDNKNICVDT